MRSRCSSRPAFDSARIARTASSLSGSSPSSSRCFSSCRPAPVRVRLVRPGPRRTRRIPGSISPTASRALVHRLSSIRDLLRSVGDTASPRFTAAALPRATPPAGGSRRAGSPAARRDPPRRRQDPRTRTATPSPGSGADVWRGDVQPERRRARRQRERGCSDAQHAACAARGARLEPALERARAGRDPSARAGTRRPSSSTQRRSSGASSRSFSS